MTLAHLSDLHLGKSAKHRTAALALCDALLGNGVDHAIVTGDITEHGLISEFDQFKDIFAEFLDEGRISLVPGNHDRLNDEAANGMMRDRIELMRLPGFSLISVDTTGPHNRWRYAGHGKLDDRLIQEILSLAKEAAATDFVAVAMHHHLLPLPEDLWLEWFSEILRLPFAAELKRGRDLLDRLQGHCDLVLHGHRHASTENRFSKDGRELTLYNAGSSTKLGQFRIFDIQNGRLVGLPVWIQAKAG
jgi:3',5'-cyclic AMP phosphodiesterase CpdA